MMPAAAVSVNECVALQMKTWVRRAEKTSVVWCWSEEEEGGEVERAWKERDSAGVLNVFPNAAGTGTEAEDYHLLKRK